MMKKLSALPGLLSLSMLLLSAFPLAYAQNDACLAAFDELRDTYSKSRAQLTVVRADPSAVIPYSIFHAGDTDVLQHLNGEIRGYALRGSAGFDYNHDRGLTGAITWHPTLIWHKLFEKDRDFPGYSCILTGRTRLAGRRVTLLRLVADDNIRYNYIIAMDDSTKMPVELTVVTPEGAISSKMTVLGSLPLETHQNPFPIDETDFDNYKAEEKILPSYAAPWPELTIPRDFKLSDRGQLQVQDVVSEFQTYTDGLTSFRVYRNDKTSVMFPALNDGALSVYRKSGLLQEYSVVGEVPLKFAEYVLQSVR